MSKYVKDLLSKDISRRLEGVSDALLVNVVGLDAGKTYVLRKQLRQRDIHLLVVKNSLAKRATEGTPLAAAFEGAEGTLAMVWGGEDFVSLAKEIMTLDGSPDFPEFQARGGVMDGERLTPERVKEVSRWPSRQEQISILVGQILSPGARLASQLLGPGRALASQMAKKADEKQADEKQADEKQADEKQADEKQADEKQADEKQADEKQVGEKQVGGEQVGGERNDKQNDEQNTKEEKPEGS